MESEASIRVETPLLFVGLALQSLAPGLCRKESAMAACIH